MRRTSIKKCEMCDKFCERVSCRFCSRDCYGIWITTLSPRAKISHICEICGKSFLIRKSRVNFGKGRFCSIDCRRLGHRKDISGVANPNWNGGVSKQTAIRCSSSRWKKLRVFVYERDSWTCQQCKKHCHRDIQCHHIVPYRISQDDSMQNLVTLCKSCHIRIEKGSIIPMYSTSNLLLT